MPIIRFMRITLETTLMAASIKLSSASFIGMVGNGGGARFSRFVHQEEGPDDKMLRSTQRDATSAAPVTTNPYMSTLNSCVTMYSRSTRQRVYQTFVTVRDESKQDANAKRQKWHRT